MSKKINFDDLDFNKFRELALSDELSLHEKVGFPDDYRQGKEESIFADMKSKLKWLKHREKIVLEIGPGCSGLPILLADLCKENSHMLHLVDSKEMLEYLPQYKNIFKWPGCFPHIPDLFDQLEGKVDVIIAYSVIQYVFVEGNLWDFIDRSLSLLADEGEILLGDIPNYTMRKRFFASQAGICSHKAYTGRDELPDTEFNVLEPGRMDDSVVFAILARARAQGYHAWVIPQAEELSMSNRREDILIRKP
ncbi:MAG: SAM-dependent methyltransferase [Legionella sp.]|nr:MAG: SAM-dependent methyltransferase [Legionella sp.]